jgi:hypothetical protein
MSMEDKHSDARHARLLRWAGLAAVLLLSPGLGACSAAEGDAVVPAAETTQATPLPLNGTLEAGTYVVTGFTVPFEVTLPDHWRILDGWRLIRDVDGVRTVFLTFLNPTHVPQDACGWSAPMPAVAPTVEAFTDALAAQDATTTSPATDVEVGGYRGVEFDIWVDEGVNNNDCSGSHVCIYGEGSDNCARWYMSVEERETYRVVDLVGDRAVLSVGQYRSEVDPATVKEARAVFDSIVFRPAD